MPYSAAHKQETRERIVERARRLFNRHGFNDVSIDDIMDAAGLTRGGFYNHFRNKEELFVEAVESYGKCTLAKDWDDVELDFSCSGPELASQVIRAYLPDDHLEDMDNHCPLMALPSDCARSTPAVKQAYLNLVKSMAGLFELNLTMPDQQDRKRRSLALTALCVGSMVLSRTFDDADFARQIREAARVTALGISRDQEC